MTITKANALADIENNEVYVCVTDNIETPISRRLSKKVFLIDLNINYYKDDWKSIWYLWRVTVYKRHKHKSVLKRVLNEINPDIVISVGQCEKYFLSSIKGNWRTIRELHFSSEYRILKADGIIKKIIARIIAWYDLKFKIKNYDQVVILTNEDKKRSWKNNYRVKVIPNPLTLSPGNSTKERKNKIISVGRLEPQKNYSSLIRAFKKISEKHNDWTLEIWGQGSQKNLLMDLIEELNLSDKVYLNGITKKPQTEMGNSSIFVMTSKYEGFPLVMIEAMSCGLPVVSYDCPTGPKDIISNGIDGFLVTSGDETSLVEKLCYLIDNPGLRDAMGKRAVEKAKLFSIDRITALWMDLFLEITE